MLKVSSSKGIAFVALMAALGNVLSFLSMQLAPLVPSIPLGPVSVSLAFDFSHIATFIAALLGGAVIGGLTGLVGGSVAAFEFGFSKGNLLTGIGLPLGKAMTGIAAGYLFQRLKREKIETIVATVVSYTPEAVFTAFIFLYLAPIFLGLPQAVVFAITLQILVKAYFEMILIGFIVSLISTSKGFRALENSLKT
jgi:hypothetical protein